MVDILYICSARDDRRGAECRPTCKCTGPGPDSECGQATGRGVRSVAGEARRAAGRTGRGLAAEPRTRREVHTVNLNLKLSDRDYHGSHGDRDYHLNLVSHEDSPCTSLSPSASEPGLAVNGT